MNEFSGKVVFVTGAGSGIGKAVALAFAAAGAELIVNDLPSQPGIHDVAAHIQSQGGTCRLALGDVSRSEDVTRMFESVEKVDVLVNNAGFLREVDILEMSDELWDQMIRVHLYGTFYCARAAVSRMIPRQHGRIINISSDLGQLGCERLTHYAAAKGGIIAFTKSLARELGQTGILVNSVAPGGTLTPLVERLGPAYVEEESARYPLRRLGHADEIANVVLFLASASSSFMTGQVIGVNGGGVMNG